MRTHIKQLLCLPTLIAGLGLMLAATARAQTFANLHSFTAVDPTYSTNSDGAIPVAALILSSNTLYGAADYGGLSADGTVFALNTDGTGFTNLHTFTAFSGSPFPITNSDGASPNELILSGNTLYGSAYDGGSSGNGTVFALDTDGKAFTNLYSFTGGSDGAAPLSGLVLSGNSLYGTAVYGGTSNNGTVFAVNTDGTGFAILHTFTAPSGPFPATNSDGVSPQAGLIVSGYTLYGTANFGGTAGSGTVFALNTAGTGFTTLYNFTRGGYNDQDYYTNSDGANPNGGLVLAGSTLYGTATTGGSAGSGTIFAVNTDGTGFTNLHTFTAATPGGAPNYFSINSDGAEPKAGLVLLGNTLYGTTSSGNPKGTGAIFAINTDGTGFTNLYSFAGLSGSAGHGLQGANRDGAHPNGLLLSGNTLYGTATAGGTSGNGTVFSLTLPPPQLTIIQSGANVILSWPTNAAGFTLEFATNLVSPTVWNTNSTVSVVIGGQNVVTNPITGTRGFFRLMQP